MWRLLAPKWLLGHVVVAMVFLAFLRLGWWQWQHAIAGNTLSYGYAAQWPLFACFGLYFWVRIVLDCWQRPPSLPAQPEQRNGTHADGPPRFEWTFGEERLPVDVMTQGQPTAVTATADIDREVVAYNDMLAWLNADPRRRLADYQPLGPAGDRRHRPR